MNCMNDPCLDPEEAARLAERDELVIRMAKLAKRVEPVVALGALLQLMNVYSTRVPELARLTLGRQLLLMGGGLTACNADFEQPADEAQPSTPTIH